MDAHPRTVEMLGSQNLAEFVPPAPDNVLSIMYTSGTTGMASLCLVWDTVHLARVEDADASPCNCPLAQGSPDYAPQPHQRVHRTARRECHD